MMYVDGYGDPPVSGIRIGHEMVTENVIEIKIQYAAQSFRGGRRELTMIDVVGDRAPEDDDELYDEYMDCAVNLPGRRPLVTGRGE